MLEPDFADQLVYFDASSSPKKLFFPLNTRGRGEREKVMAELIRQCIKASGAKEVKVPICMVAHHGDSSSRTSQ